MANMEYIKSRSTGINPLSWLGAGRGYGIGLIAIIILAYLIISRRIK